MSAVTSQPISINGTSGREWTYPGGVLIRTMKEDDSEFAGRLLVEAFQSKFESVGGKQHVSKFVSAEQDNHRRQAVHYSNIYIAEVEGQRTGLMELRYHGYKPNDSGPNPYSKHLGCATLCRFAVYGGILKCACAGSIVEEKVKSGDCYLDHICVESFARGKGVGNFLLDVADKQAAEHKCNKIYLWAYDGNRAKNLYLRHGYEITDSMGNCCVKCAVGMSPFVKMEKNVSNL